MTDNQNDNNPNFSDAIDKAKEAAQIAGASVTSIAQEKIDTEQVGKHARRLRDRAELFVYDNKLEIAAVVVFTAGFWAGRRVLARGFLKELANRKTAYLELAIDEKQVKRLIKNKDDLSLLFDTPDGVFALRATDQ